MKVRRDSRFEILRLTHIDDGMVLVVILIAAWFLRQPTDDTFQIR